MAQYIFDTQADLIDELMKTVEPRALAEYMYNNSNQYSLDLQWELDTFRLDDIYEDYETELFDREAMDVALSKITLFPK